MGNNSFDFKPFAFLIFIGMVALLVVGVNFSTRIDPVRAAEADAMNAETQHQRNMYAIEEQQAPEVIKARIARQQLFATAGAYALVILAAALAVIVVMFAWSRLRGGPVTVTARAPDPYLPPGRSRREVYQEMSRQHHRIPIDPTDLYRTRRR